MSVLTRSQAKARKALAHTVFSRANPSKWAPALSSEFPQQTSLEGGVDCSDRAFECHPSTLVVGNEGPPAVCNYKNQENTRKSIGF